MKIVSLSKALIFSAFLASLSVGRAEPQKEVTIKGEAQCAKCSLHQAKECASAIVAKEDGKDVTYYIVDNETSKKLLPHDDICTSKKKVQAKGTVKEVDGKKELTLTSLSPAK